MTLGSQYGAKAWIFGLVWFWCFVEFGLVSSGCHCRMWRAENESRYVLFLLPRLSAYIFINLLHNLLSSAEYLVVSCFYMSCINFFLFFNVPPFLNYIIN